MLVLGIETSCDETAASIVEDGERVLSNIVSSSLPLHRRFGGVVPEIACRAHVESINYVLEQALRKASVSLKDIDLVAVTFGPGLVGALLVGISVAKAIAFSSGIPLVGVNHLEAHLQANFLRKPTPKAPFVGLVISGGHTSLVYRASVWGDYEFLGQTRDDAVGEAFDKVAKILGLGYPGGPAIDRLARFGDPERIRFPRVYLKEGSLDFSFSGIKTAVLYYVRDHIGYPVSRLAGYPEKRRQTGRPANRKAIKDIAASFQEAVVDTLIQKTLSACRMMQAQSVVVGGGVAANSRLREKLTRRLGEVGIKVYFPAASLCTDNACMVASLGYHRHRLGLVSDLSLPAVPNLGVTAKTQNIA